jgi:signal transduction histidine kinase
MKKNIVIGLSVLSIILLMGGISIITTIEKETSNMNNLLKLHRAEILREQLLLHLKNVQSDLSLKKTRHTSSIDTTVVKVRDIENTLDKCFDCHHSTALSVKLNALRSQANEYKNALSRVFTAGTDTGILEKEEGRAIKIGESLITQVEKIITLTYPRLWEKTTSALGEIAHTKSTIYILVALGPLSIIGIVFIFIKFFTRPLNTLLKATERLKEGDLDYRVEGLKNEFGKVAESFNEMSASLKEQMIKMQRTEQMVVLGELSAGLAHEIKNPLTGIKLSLEVISNEESISKDNKDTLLKLTDECRRIDSLIKNLLNFAKPPHPKLLLIDINSVLDKTILFSLQHTSLLSNDDSPINVSKDLDKTIPEIMADPIKLQQAFLNLLLNAVHAMPDGGTLSVMTSYDKEANIIRIKLSDTGKGIDNEVISRIFQPFFTTKPKGTGLGLAITKRLIEQHDGTLSVENNPDGGAVFTISIPVSESKKE